MSRRKNFRQSNWLIELSPRKNFEPRIVGICPTFRGSTVFRLVEIRFFMLDMMDTPYSMARSIMLTWWGHE